jgi:anti-anti-sigma factor
MDTRPFALSLVDGDRVFTLTLTGDLDLGAAPELAAAVEKLPAGCDAIVDLRGLTFMDSTGLGHLLALATRDDLVASFIPGPTNVQRIFEITQTLSLCEWTEPVPDGAERRMPV